MSLPSNLIRELANPTEVMTLWNDVVRLQDELGTHGARRHMAERINIDVQVSVDICMRAIPRKDPSLPRVSVRNIFGGQDLGVGSRARSRSAETPGQELGLEQRLYL